MGGRKVTSKLIAGTVGKKRTKKRGDMPPEKLSLKRKKKKSTEEEREDLNTSGRSNGALSLEKRLWGEIHTRLNMPDQGT